VGSVQIDRKTFSSLHLADQQHLNQMGNYGLSWTIEVKDQTIVIPKEYIELMELQDGTQYEVKLGRKQIRLHRIFDDEKDED